MTFAPNVADPLHMPLTDPIVIEKRVAVILTVIYHRACLEDALNQISMFGWEGLIVL